MNKPALPEVVRIASEIAQALAAAHARGLVHRDVKPANVFLEGPGRRVKLLDFGLARPQDEATHLTKTGMIVGTPMFMAPEQARGEDVDGRTDLFSLGGIMYQMVTGRPPFEGKNAMAVVSAVISDNPLPASDFNPTAPAALVQLISRLLSKKPEGRPASAAAVLAELYEIAPGLLRPRRCWRSCTRLHSGCPRHPASPGR
jgi:serine/threonine protein kinase